MTTNIDFKYGSGKVAIPLPDGNFTELMPKKVSPIQDLEQELNQVLDGPIGTKPFNEIFCQGDKVVIIASDVTRVVRLNLFLPHIVDRLNRLGIPDENIIVIIALGTHRHQTDEERKQIVGEEMYNRLEVIDHDCDGAVTYMGKTKFGTEVEINRLVAERKTILTGSIVHHLMAGFGGGRKSIVPGVASRKTVRQNHNHALDPENERSNPLIGVGVTAGNPINEDMVECTRLVNPDFLINAVMDPDGNIAKIFCGHWLSAWEQGCKWADETFGVTLAEDADLVITSCGGFPKDISLYQGTKTMFNANLAVKPGGTILMLAECREGAGADSFFGWSKPLIAGNLDSALRSNFTIAGYIFYAAVEVAKRAKVILYSSIDPESVKPMGITATNSLTEAMELAEISRHDQKTVIIPYGGNTIPKLVE
ncbi:nickel-dependent lactate racemase [Metallumcola ferriviriculae]|uniref:Nickel-dependent lactate racemase n=1 Tax=Metallumcola ferriviriculae TaxID=3039180 RepID=A0AAU0UPP4_9FIRM|nr:nickel-dependent lactate racemase [Desulfitibacteraceae bacterium MK1]